MVSQTENKISLATPVLLLFCNLDQGLLGEMGKASWDKGAAFKGLSQKWEDCTWHEKEADVSLRP